MKYCATGNIMIGGDIHRSHIVMNLKFKTFAWEAFIHLEKWSIFDRHFHKEDALRLHSLHVRGLEINQVEQRRML